MKHARYFLVALLAVTAAGCLTLEGEQFNMLSTPQEVQLGQQVAAQIEKDEKILNDPALQAYVSQIGERLARVSPRQDIAYAFKVIDAPDTVNAFALPGGYMYLYTGLMKLCENEAELAAVMAHEIGHLAGHHHGQSYTRQYGYQLILGTLLGEEPSTTAQIVAGLVGQGVESRFSRDQEYQADAVGLDILFRAGYSPDAMLSFMQKMLLEDQKRGGSRPLAIFATHPPTAERLASLQQLASRYPADARTNSPTYPDRYRQNVLAKLGR